MNKINIVQILLLAISIMFLCIEIPELFYLFSFLFILSLGITDNKPFTDENYLRDNSKEKE